MRSLPAIIELDLIEGETLTEQALRIAHEDRASEEFLRKLLAEAEQVKDGNEKALQD